LSPLKTILDGVWTAASPSVEAEATAPQPSVSGYKIVLWIGLVFLLVAELIILTLPFDPKWNLANRGFWAATLLAGQRGIRPTFITLVAATIFFSWRVLQQEFRRVLDESPGRTLSARWLAAHLILLGLLIYGTRDQSSRLNSIAAWEGWLFLWGLIALAALITWLLTALPPRFWIRWIGQSRSAFLGAGAAGFAAYALGNWTQELWWPLQQSTFRMVALILQLLGQTAVNRPEELAIGTSRFVVTIRSECSGLEGIGLICAFIGIYLWSYRHELIFPQAFLLFPIGAIAVWIFNSLRIAALIFIGGWSEEAALKGFHSAAGWVFFNFVAIGLVWTSSRSQLFARASKSQLLANPAIGYLLPAIIFFAVSLIAHVLWPGVEFFLAAITVPILISLWYCRATLLSLRWKPSPLSIFAGALAFAVVSVLSSRSSADASFGATLHQLPLAEAIGLLMLCLVGGVIAMPTTQELAFRGYVARKLVAADFENVPFSRFTWLSFLGSSMLFGITQPNWLPATLAGMIFALVMYRRGSLSDAIVAHAFSSGLLFLFAATTGKWSLLR